MSDRIRDAEAKSAVPVSLRARRLSLAALALALGGAGCATGSTELREHDLGRGAGAAWSGSAFLLDYEMRLPEGARDTATIRSDGCELTLHPRAETHELRVHVRADGPGAVETLFADLPPGDYVADELDCPYGMKWKIGSLGRDGFSVDPGKINYLGKVIFRFAPDPAGGLGLTLAGADAPATARALAADLARFPKPWLTSIQDPYTHKPITEAMLSGEGGYHMNIHARHTLREGAPTPALTELERVLEGCDQAEQKRFPYRLGTLKDEATYERGRFVSFTTSGENSFSSVFLACLDQGLRSYRPPAMDKLVVTVTL